jgi:hypothetical protein
MKGLIDLRVSNILAKQAAMQHEAARFQSRIAQHEADRAAFYTAKADKLEEAFRANSYDPNDTTKSAPPFDPPHSSVWYSPWGSSVLGKGRVDLTSVNLPPVMIQSIDPILFALGSISPSKKAQRRHFI